MCARSLSRARRRASSSRVGVCCVLVSRKNFFVLYEVRVLGLKNEGEEKNIPLKTNSSSLSFVAVRTCGDFFVSRATPQTHISSLSLALSSSRCFCGRSFFLSSLSKKDQQTRFGFLLIFCAQIGNFQRENIIETQLCVMFPRARS